MHTLLQPLGELFDDYSDLPFAFFGHCAGGITAFELARLLRQRGTVQPACLFISGQGAPQLATSLSTADTLPKDEFLRRISQAGGMEDALLSDKRLMAVLEPILLADYRLYKQHKYRQEPPLDIPISVFGWKKDRIFRTESLAAWHVHTRREFTLRMLAGDHFSATTAGLPLVRALWSDLQASLE